MLLKALPRMFRQEPAVVAAVARYHRTLVPELLAVHEAEAWMVMTEVRGSLLMLTADPQQWLEALQRVGRLQATLSTEIDSIAAEAALRRLPLEGLDDALAELLDVITSVEGPVVIDWTDSTISHPFISGARALSAYLRASARADHPLAAMRGR